MKKYQVHYTRAALKTLKKLERPAACAIYAWIEKNLVNCSNPLIQGKALTANLAGQWRYRVGDWHLIAQIQDDKVLILMLAIGHRSDIYKRH